MADVALQGHDLRDDRKLAGATYTPADLAAAVARRLTLAFFQKGKYVRRIRVLDPGVGDGALLHAVLSALDPALHEALEVVGVDISCQALSAAQCSLMEAYPDISFNFIQQDFLAFYEEVKCRDEWFDLVISNPPYVRVQALPEHTKVRAREMFGLTGRMDLSYAFVMAIKGLLSEKGAAAIITSNRILKTEAACSVRKSLEGQVREVWDLGDTNLFDAAVLPCVLFLEGSRAGLVGEAVFRSAYRMTGEAPKDALAAASVCDVLLSPGHWDIPGSGPIEIKLGYLSVDAGWRLGSEQEDEFARRVSEATWATFADVSKICVGIKSTADKVFISKDWEAPVPELLRPLLTHHVSGRFCAASPADRRVLYPYESHEGCRRAVNLDLFPLSKAHLLRHRERLAGRSYLQQAGREWFEIWVPHDPEGWRNRKIVFRDIAERPTFWMDETGAVVNGDCYWIKMNDDIDEDIAWLMLSVANSKTIETYYDIVLGERIYAGRRRFMSRHVRRFPLPDPSLEASQQAALLARKLARDDLDQTTRKNLEQENDRLVSAAFKLT